MNKEEMLRKGFSHGAANVAIRYADEEIDFLVLRSEMVEYARTVSYTHLDVYKRQPFHIPDV